MRLRGVAGMVRGRRRVGRVIGVAVPGGLDGVRMASGWSDGTFMRVSPCEETTLVI